VSESEIRFKIMFGSDGGIPVDRTYKYEVWPNGRVQPFPMASEEAVSGIGKFDWQWDGSQITQTDPRNGSLPPKVFRRERPE
jgi:hypothetical protein